MSEAVAAKLSIEQESQLQEPRLVSRYVLWGMLLLTIVLSVWAVIARGAAIEWFLLTLSSFIVVSSIVFPSVAIRTISFERVLSRHVLENEPLIIHSKLKRSIPLPGLWYAVIEPFRNESAMESKSIQLIQHYQPFMQLEMSQRFYMKELARGQYTADSVTVVVGDWLGITTFTKIIACKTEFTVLPQLLPQQEETYLSQLTSAKWNKQDKPYINTHTDASYKSKLDEDSSQWSGVSEQMRTYRDGDAIHRINYFALAKGQGLHVFKDEYELPKCKSMIFIDQYMPPMENQQKKLMFETMIGWVLDQAQLQLRQSSVFVVTDNWCYECSSYDQLSELQQLLASLRTDVQHTIATRLTSLLALIPDGGDITVYSTDWKSSEGWAAFGEGAWQKQATLTLQLLTQHRVMTYSMREQQRHLEQQGIKLVWRYSNFEWPQMEVMSEGSEQYGYTS